MSPSKIVITGTIASGKSTLVGLINELGFRVISADDVNRKLLEPGSINYEAIKNSHLYDEAFIGDELDKKKLAQIIFKDKDKLLQLNRLTHRNILDDIDRQANALDDKVVFIEIPLYFQMEEKYEADEVWIVVADYDTQLTRLMDRDGIDICYAKQKIETQENLIDMKEGADIVFDNSTSVRDLMRDLKNVLESKDLI